MGIGAKLKNIIKKTEPGVALGEKLRKKPEVQKAAEVVAPVVGYYFGGPAGAALASAAVAHNNTQGSSSDRLKAGARAGAIAYAGSYAAQSIGSGSGSTLDKVSTGLKTIQVINTLTGKREEIPDYAPIPYGSVV